MNSNEALTANRVCRDARARKTDVRALVERYFDVINGADVALLDGLVAEDCVDHDPIPHQPPGLPGVRLKVMFYRATLPDARSTIDGIVPFGEAVFAVAWTMTASGLCGSPRQGACRFTALFTVGGGRIRESRLVAVRPLGEPLPE
jgi:ketosteroid isomerase-like protein